MSDYLQKIVYLTQSDYDILAQGTEENPTSVTKNGVTLTNLDENCLYITDGGVVSSDISGVINVSHGGTGKDTLLSGQVLVGNGENPITTIIKTSANTANTLVERDANGNFSAHYITMTQGYIGNMSLYGNTIAALDFINTNDGNGLLAYKPSNWTGVSSSNQWGVGTINLQGVIRSNNSDLLHSRAGTNSVILDAGNYKTYAYALDGSNTGTKLQISTQSAAYSNGIQFMNSTTKKGSIGSDSNGVVGIYGSKISLRPQLDAASLGVEITTDAMYPTTSITLGTTSKKWSTVYATNLNGNLNVAAHSNTTDGTKNYYPWFGTAQNGSLAAQAHYGFYIFETVSNGAISQLDICMGSSTITGSITMWDGVGQRWANIKPSTLSTNRQYTLPDATGTIALTSSDITGNAATATSSKVLANQNGTYGTATTTGNRVTDTNIAHVNNGGVTHFKVGTATNGPTGGGNILHFHWDTSDAWDAQLHIPNNSINSMSWRASSAAGTWGTWRTILDSNNYTDYTVTKTGSGASGSWGISITGSSASCTGKSASSDALNFVHTNEILIGNNNTQSIVHINHRRVLNGATSGNTAITDYYFKNGNGATTGVTIHAANFNGLAAKATADASGNTITTTYAKLASPALTGTPTAPTAANGTSTTQIATTAFVNNTLAYANAMTFKGTLGTGGTITSLPASHNAGDTYRVITAGTWAGKYCEVGTLIICIKDGTAAADADWTSVETNEDGAVVGPTSSTDNAIVRFNGSTGRIVQNSGVTIDDNDHLIAPSIRIANTYYGISFERTTSTPVETILHTGIKWVSGSHMPVIHITGYAYGLTSPVEFKIGFYIYGDKIGWCGATNMGSWEPDIYLFKDTRNGVNYVAVGLAGSCYFLQLSVDLQDEMGKFNNVISTNWSWDFLTTTGTIPSADDGTTCVKVPYKASIFGAKYANITTTSNAIAYYTNTTGTFGSKASANGALYATSTNGALQWGTLPIAQGGTGKTSAAEAWTALGGGASGKHEDTYFVKAITSTANGIPRFNETTGQIKNSQVTIDDNNNLYTNNSIYIIKAGECGIEVKNTQTTNPNQVAFIVGSSGNGGIYSRKHSKWIVYADASGNVVLNGNANTATTATNLSAAPTIASGGTATVNLSANTAYTLTVGGKSVIFKTPADSNTDTKVNYTLAATTKAYLMASSDAPTSTATGREAKGDSNVYLTATAGELSAVRHSYNISGTEKAYSYYNTTLNSIDFVFV